MRSLYFVLLLLLVSAVSFSHVGTVFAFCTVFGCEDTLIDTDPTLTIVIVANNGPRIVDLKIMTLVPHPWGAGDSDSLYGWGLIEEKAAVNVGWGTSTQKTLLYDLSPGLYVINVCWGADVGGLMTSVVHSQMVELQSDATVTFVVN